MTSRLTGELPSALDSINTIKSGMGTNSPIGVFLDYDGTMTPIVNRPEDAVLSGEMRDVVRRLAERYPVAVISGRGLADIRRCVGLEDIFYAGSHGFEIAGPGGWHEEYSEAAGFLPLLDRMEEELYGILDGLAGIQIERKRYSIAVHYRNADSRARKELDARIPDLEQKHRHKLRLSSGKCVYDFQPGIDWHKGKALIRLLEAAFEKPDEVFPIYIGDDITDEDAFREITERGIGIVVRDAQRPTEAKYALDSPAEVLLFLESFAGIRPENR